MLDFQFYFELIGAVAFAVSGAALAVKKGMDLFGVAMMGMTTAVGGGILRDVMLGQTPPAALRDPLQALVAVGTSLLVFLVWKRFRPQGDHRTWDAALLVADSIGLGIFSAHGAAIAIQAGGGDNAFLVLFMGMLTGVGGGVLRGGGLSAAVERRAEPGAAGGLRRDGGAAHLRGCVPVEPAQGVTRKKTAFAVFFYAVSFSPTMPTSSSPTKMRRGALTGSGKARMPTITAPRAPMPVQTP